MSVARLAYRNKKFKRCKKCFPVIRKKRNRKIKIDFEDLEQDDGISEELITALLELKRQEKLEKKEKQEEEEEDLLEEQRSICRCR